MKKKKMILALSLSGFLITSLFASTIIYNQINKEEENLVEYEVGNQKGIKIASIKYSEASSIIYGIERIQFYANPKIHTDEILYSLKYTDGSEVEVDVFDINFQPTDNYIELSCLKPFFKQIILTIYAKSNESINATITIDFKEKVTLNPMLIVNEGSPLVIETNMESTGGSILADKTFKNVSITFNETFLTTVEEKLRARFEEIHYSNPQTTNYTEISQQFFGLTQTDCDNLFVNNFSYSDFLKSFYVRGEYTWIESDSDYEDYVIANIYATDLTSSDFFALFDGKNPVFDYSCTVNNKTYNKSFGLDITTLGISEITSPSSRIYF